MARPAGLSATLRSVSVPRPSRFPFWALLLLTALLIAADQALKVWAAAHLPLHGEPRSWIPGLISGYLTYNTGAAWSLFAGAAPLLALGRLAVGLGLLWYLWRRPGSALLSLPLTFIAAGALGNAIDGLRQGQVTDMLYSPLLSSVTRALGKGDFPIFNLADSCVVGGTLALVALSFAAPRREAHR